MVYDWESVPTQNQYHWIQQLVIHGPRTLEAISFPSSRDLLDRLVEEGRWVKIQDGRYTATDHGYALVKLVLEAIAVAGDAKTEMAHIRE